jgi:hypothetical protein
MMAVALAGCMTAALQLAPIAVQAVEDVGYGVIKLAADAAMPSHDHGDQQDNSNRDKSQICATMETQPPLVIEFRTDATGGNLQYRELTLNDDSGASKWQVLADPEADAYGWRPTVNLATMDFQPPINSWLKAGSRAYIAYAPEGGDDSDERAQYDDLVTDFGPRFGMFHWKGNTYDYGVLPELPCFPPPEG